VNAVGGHEVVVAVVEVPVVTVVEVEVVMVVVCVVSVVDVTEVLEVVVQPMPHMTVQSSLAAPVLLSDPLLPLPLSANPSSFVLVAGAPVSSSTASDVQAVFKMALPHPTASMMPLHD
jgi:hypothetical protein